jgi:hypothetical protein
MVKQLFLQRTFANFKTVKAAFSEWKTAGEGCIDIKRFSELMEFWGFSSQT